MQSRRGRPRSVDSPMHADLSAQFLNRFVRTHGTNGARVYLPTLRSRYQLRANVIGNVKEKFKRYIAGDRVPDAETAWQIGECLQPDVPWMNGLCSLWSFGYVGNAVGIASLWFEDHQKQVTSQPCVST